MKRSTTLATAGAAFALLAAVTTGVAFAQDGAGGGGKGDMAAKLKERFAAADKNGDGKLTKDEAKAGMPFVYKHFDDIDKAHTGTVTMIDIAAYAKQMHAAKQGS